MVKGVFIKDEEWLALKNTSKLVLVEDSVQSQKGAGE